MRWVPPVDRASSSTPPPRSIVLAARSHRSYLAALEGFEYPSTPGSFRTESREEALAWHEAQAKAKEFVVFGEVAAIALTIASFAATAMAVAGAALGDWRISGKARRVLAGLIIAAAPATFFFVRMEGSGAMLAAAVCRLLFCVFPAPRARSERSR